MPGHDDRERGQVPRIGVIRPFDEAARTKTEKGWVKTPESGLRREAGEPRERPTAPPESDRPPRT